MEAEHGLSLPLRIARAVGHARLRKSEPGIWACAITRLTQLLELFEEVDARERHRRDLRETTCTCTPVA